MNQYNTRLVLAKCVLLTVYVTEPYEVMNIIEAVVPTLVGVYLMAYLAYKAVVPTLVGL